LVVVELQSRELEPSALLKLKIEGCHMLADWEETYQLEGEGVWRHVSHSDDHDVVGRVPVGGIVCHHLSVEKAVVFQTPYLF
jgi:hypothetical protein